MVGLIPDLRCPGLANSHCEEVPPPLAAIAVDRGEWCHVVRVMAWVGRGQGMMWEGRGRVLAGSGRVSTKKESKTQKGMNPAD